MSPAVPTGAAGQSAVHTITSSLTAGTFTIGPLDGMTTVPLGVAASGAASVTGAEVAAAIRQALSLPVGSIVGTGAAGGPWTITIAPNLVTPLAANTAFTITLTGATGTVTDVVTTEGIPGGDAVSGSGAITSENPRIVGAAGQAAYAASFESPAGKSVTVAQPVAAAAASSSLEPAQFYLDADGYVHLEGVAVATGTVTTGKLIFTLPEGYRPFQDENLGALVVKANGEVLFEGAASLTVGQGLALYASFRPAGV